MPRKLSKIEQTRADEAYSRTRYNRFSFTVTLLSVVVMGYIATKYWNSAAAYDAAFARYALLLAMFAGTGLLVYRLRDKIQGQEKSNAKRPPEKILGFEMAPLDAAARARILMTWVVLFGIGLVLEALIVGLYEVQRSAVSDMDLALYFVFAGPAEENFFRGFLLNVLSWSFGEFPGGRDRSPEDPNFKELWDVVRGNLVPLILSALAFALSHLEVYGARPHLLVVQFLLGLIWGVGYLYARDITPCIGAHMSKNVFAAGNILAR